MPQTPAPPAAAPSAPARAAGPGPAAGRERTRGDAGAAGIAVLVVEDALGEDGAARSNLRLVDRWLRAPGARVELYAVQRSARGAPVPAGVRPLYPTAHGAVRLRRTLAVAAVQLVARARAADVVVSGREIGWGLLLGRLAARVARRPFVVIVRSEPSTAVDQYVAPRLRGATLRALRTADRVVCITPGLVPAVRRLGVDAERVSVVLNGVEVDRILAAAAVPAAHLPGGEGPLVVGVGRLHRQKGFDVLVRAHARVVAAGVPHRLLLLGEGPERQALDRLAEGLGVAGSVTLAGFVDEPVPVLAAADLYCLPSRWEGFGQALAEALLVGTPVVAADCVAGPRELLADGRRGDLVPVDDVVALADAVERHLRAPQRLRDAAAEGRRWAVSALDVRRTADEVLAVLRDVAARRAG